MQKIRTGDEFRKARMKLGLSVAGLASLYGCTERTVRYYQAAAAPDPLACRALEWMIAGFRPPGFDLACDLRAKETGTTHDRQRATA